MSPETPPKRPFVTCRALSKAYVTPTGTIEALHEVDADFELGGITAVVGASGSGKSTLLRAIAGLDRPTGGTLRVGERELGEASPAALRHHRRQAVTFVSQKPADNFVPHLTIADQTEADRGTALSLLADFGVAGRLGSKPAELSGGEQARAAFALALARGTPLVVADEPTAELDRDSARRLLAAIRDHAGAGVGFVLATHDHDVVGIADRVLRLERGRVLDGEAEPAGRVRPGAARTRLPAVVYARGVSKSYRRGGETVHALQSANVELGSGEVGVLLGRSGSGKSTLLALLGGWQSPDSGEIGYPGAHGGPAGLAWAQLALLPQRFGLLTELSVRENVEHPARLAGRLEAEQGWIEELLGRFGLDELAGRVPQETSIGQQQRTALARALALRPAVLLADEPTSHQDAGWRDAVWEVLRQAAADGTSCLVATHEEEIAHYATRVWMIAEGVTTETS